MGNVKWFFEPVLHFLGIYIPIFLGIPHITLWGIAELQRIIFGLFLVLSSSVIEWGKGT